MAQPLAALPLDAPLSTSSNSSSNSSNKPLLHVADHIPASLKNLYLMQQDGVLCDVVFVIPRSHVGEEDERFPCHKAVLASTSHYFRALFTNNMFEAKAEEIILEGVHNPQAFRLLIEFLYTGKICQPGNGELVEEVADSILGVLELADLYAVEPLFLACTTFLKQRVCVANCVKWLRFTAHLPNCTELYQTCLSFFCSHLNEFSNNTVAPFDLDLFVSVVSSECLRVDNELQVLELVSLWLCADPTRLDTCGLRVLRQVRFTQVPLVALEPWIQQIKEPRLTTLCFQALLEQISGPTLDVNILSASGWANTRFYPISLYDRQTATVFKQGPDAGLVRAIVLSPDRSLLFTGSSASSSSEIVLPNTGNQPEPCLRIWNTATWRLEQTLPCGEDFVALTVQENSYANPPEPALPGQFAPNYMLISAHVSRQSHHHNPKLRLRAWEYQNGRWACTKELPAASAYVKNPVLFAFHGNQLLVGNYRNIQVWNTRTWVREREWQLDATVRTFVVCSCGHELLGRCVRDIRAWDTNTWQGVRVMPAKLQGAHKAKLASCLAIHRNRLLFPMRDCIISCDPHTGARLQRYVLPPQPSSISPSLKNIPSFSSSDAWLLSSFVLAGDLLFVATYQGWLAIFTLSYTKPEEQGEVKSDVPADPNDDGLLHFHCERYWQTAGTAMDKGAVVNCLAVVTRSPSSSNLSSASAAVSSSMDADSTALSPSSSSAGTGWRGDRAPTNLDAHDDVEDAVEGVITVLDYGHVLAVWRRC
eukprot:TRINITY_DN1600_c0_g2_i1.p1 TRINITY_DN1600_c0_g2~~TRINITY_DN1600_c0_g2_i1.p1  ORF type:complete len:762 (-),score=123.05 TRINITY_DN1600_c0_g2_i1:38-2323(-)